MIAASLPNFSALPFIMLLVGGVFALNLQKKPAALIIYQNISKKSSARSLGIAGGACMILFSAIILLQKIYGMDGGVLISFNV